MGMYTGIRFKGYIKEEYRDNFEDIALSGNWDESGISEFEEFGNSFSRASFIPRGSLCYMPDEWEKYDSKHEKYSDEWYRSVMDTDGFHRTWDKESGYWTFQCSLKNYEDEIEAWLELLPLFVDKIEHLEYFYEEWSYSRQYKLIDNEIVCTNDKFVKYERY